jgi:CheY-like chemotaxis protein
MALVLVVDDEPLLREELQESLEFEGYDVLTAADVPEALELCDQHSFDYVVTDLKMPKLGGLALLEALKNKGATSKIFVVSGHGAESNRDQALELGAAACFAKPVCTDSLIEAFTA